GLHPNRCEQSEHAGASGLQNAAAARGKSRGVSELHIQDDNWSRAARDWPSHASRAPARIAQAESAELQDSVDKPVRPWPMEHPNASAPPQPISVPPAT